MQKKPAKQPHRAAPQKGTPQQKQKSSVGTFQLLIAKIPVLAIFFALAWLWAGWYYGSVFHVSREYSFWSSDARLMTFILSQPYGILRYIGRAMLQLYQYPWIGGLLMALMLTAGSWLTGYCMRLKGSWQAIQYVPALLYVAIVTWLGLDIFFEARTGFIFGIPFAALVVLCIWAIIICSFKPRKRENGKKGIQLAVIVVVQFLMRKRSQTPSASVAA